MASELHSNSQIGVEGETPIGQSKVHLPTGQTASFSDPSSNPLYIHSSDHAGISLVSEKLTGLGNFGTWRRSMVMALKARNKLVFVDGSYPDLDETHPDYGSWSRCVSIICTWIINAVDRDIAKSIIYLDSARQMWIDIHDQFKQSNGPRTAEIKQMLFCEIQGQQTVNGYYTRLKQLWEELKNNERSPSCCCGRSTCIHVQMTLEEKEHDRVLKFLMGLNDNYKAIRGHILMMEPKPSLTKVFNLISQEERQRNMSSGAATSAPVFQTSQQNSNDSVIAAYGHFKGKNIPVCTHCGMQGHTVNRCYKLHGYPIGYKSGKSYQGQNQSGNNQSKQNQRKESIANVVVQGVNNQENESANVTNPESIPSDQVQKLLSFMRAAPDVMEKYNQFAGANISLPDGT